MMRAAASIAAAACAALLLGAASTAGAQDCSRTNRFKTQWMRLDVARSYRSGFGETTTDGATGHIVRANNKSYQETLQAYPQPDPGSGIVPRDEFYDLLDEFGDRLDDPNPSIAQEAACGFRETLNEILAGESLVGNDQLLHGLRTRYPGSDPLDPDQLTLLKNASATFRNVVELAADRIRQRPERLRSRGTVNLDFPFFVKDTPIIAGTEGEVVENEYYRFTDVLDRFGLAGNTVGRRMFFFGNDKPEKRDEAAQVFQATAQVIYLGSALLAASETPTDFQENNGHTVKREVNDAQQTFEDIRAGFNPLTLRGDFEPFQSTDNLLSLAGDMVAAAKNDEANAGTLAREYDEDQTMLADELRRQRETYDKQLSDLIGIKIRPGDPSCTPPDETKCDLSKPEDRNAILALARDVTYMCGPQAALDPLDCAVTADQGGCDAAICNNYRAYTGAQIDLREAQRGLYNFAEQIRIEEERSATVTRIRQGAAQTFSALDIAQGIVEAVVPDINVGAEFGVTFHPGAAVVGIINSQRTLLESVQDIQLEQTDSAATIKNLLLQLATQGIAVQRAALAVVEANTQYTTSIGDLEDAVRNSVSAREDLAQAYFSNPAYRLQLERSQQDAEASFQDAMVAAYKATKALEYEWADRFQNPVLRTDGSGDPESLGAQFDAITRAESVFAVKSAGGSAGAPSPTLQTYVQSLKQWDSTMRQLRAPERMPPPGQTVRISVKKVLGFDSQDQAFNRLAFRDRISKSRFPIVGSNPPRDDLILEFPLEIGDEKFLPFAANLKISPQSGGTGGGGLSVNLKAVPGRELNDAPLGNPPLVDLVMLDQAVLRTFFARQPPQGDDELISTKLEGARSFVQSHFSALSVQATIDGVGNITPNTQLANRSPAVSRWQLRIRGQNGVNSQLLLDNLDDIEILMSYVFGKPEEFIFPSVH